MRTRKHVKIVKYHRNSTVYIDGRYLCVDTKISTRSKRGREIARETVQAILEIVGSSEPAFDVIQNDRTVANAPTAPDSFSQEDSARATREAVAGHIGEGESSWPDRPAQ